MTSAPVKEVNPLMNYVSGKPKGNLQDSIAGSFTDAFSKASGQQGMLLQKDGGVQGSTKVQVQNTDKKELVKANTVKASSKETRTQEVPADKNVQEEMQKAGEELVGKVAEELGVTQEEVVAAMEMLGLTMVDLLNGDNMTQLVLTIEGEDMISLMTDEGLYNSLQNLLSMVSEAGSQVTEEFGISPEELAAMIEQAKTPETETETEMAADEKPVIAADEGSKQQIPERKEDYTVTVEKNGETVKVSVETDGGNTAEREEVTALKPQTAEAKDETGSGKEESSKKDSSPQRENTQETTHGNLLLENLLNRNSIAKTEAVFENSMAQSTADTQNIMNQIMDYMRVQVRADMTQMELQLNPASLGTVNINITSKAGVITAQFLTQNEAVKAAIESQIVQLKNSFEEQGLKVEAVEVTVASHSFERNLSGEGNGQHQMQDGRKKGTRRVNLNGTALEEEQEEEEGQETLMGAGESTVNFTA